MGASRPSTWFHLLAARPSGRVVVGSFVCPTVPSAKVLGADVEQRKDDQMDDLWVGDVERFQPVSSPSPVPVVAGSPQSTGDFATNGAPPTHNRDAIPQTAPAAARRAVTKTAAPRPRSRARTPRSNSRSKRTSSKTSSSPSRPRRDELGELGPLALAEARAVLRRAACRIAAENAR